MMLEKWYADAVDEAGAHILYRANLTVGPLVLGYAGEVGHAQQTSRFRLGGIALPALRDDTVCWPATDDGRAPKWRGALGREHTLWQRNRETVRWNPLVLNGSVGVQDASSTTRGYAERLVLNVRPWHLHLRALKWGRFCGAQHSLVWIEWQGRYPLRLALLDGARCPLVAAGPEHVDIGPGSLRVIDRRSVVEERIADALLGLQLPSWCLPRFLRGVESKWLGEGELKLTNGLVDPGHVVFEEVVWP